MKIFKLILLAVAAFTVPFIIVYQNKEAQTKDERIKRLEQDSSKLEHSIDSLIFLTDTGYVSKFFKEKEKDSLLARLDFMNQLNKYIQESQLSPQYDFNLPKDININYPGLDTLDRIKSMIEQLKTLPSIPRDTQNIPQWILRTDTIIRDSVIVLWKTGYDCREIVIRQQLMIDQLNSDLIKAYERLVEFCDKDTIQNIQKRTSLTKKEAKILLTYIKNYCAKNHQLYVDHLKDIDRRRKAQN